MNIAVLILVGAIVLGIPLSFMLFPGGRFPRVLAALVLIVLTLFCIFGFMASFEYSETAKRLPWQIGYGVLCLACLSGAVASLRSCRRSSTPSSIDNSR